MHTLDLGLYSYLNFVGSGFRTHFNSKGKKALFEAQKRVYPAMPHHAGQWTQHTTDWAFPAPSTKKLPAATKKVYNYVCLDDTVDKSVNFYSVFSLPLIGFTQKVPEACLLPIGDIQHCNIHPLYGEPSSPRLCWFSIAVDDHITFLLFFFTQ